ncbi:MAG: hypothetical protein GYB65_08500, partial [Chloroflexi bacterium]|nr:hypothetical protein [Chloroflexota bacterium]
MPDERNNMSDDSLLPDWLQGMDSELDADGWAASQDVAGDSLSAAEETSAGEPTDLSQPPWHRLRGQHPPAPAAASTPAPWHAQAGPPTAPPQAPSVAAPWGTASAPPALPPTAEPAAPVFTEKPALIPSDVEPTDDPFAFEWEDDALPDAPGGDQDEIPRGLTGALPWMDSGPVDPAPPSPPFAQDPAGLADDQFTMDDLLSEFEDEFSAPDPADAQPSLKDRLLALSPEPGEPTPDDIPPIAGSTPEEPDWLFDLGEPEAAAPNGVPEPAAPTPAAEPAPSTGEVGGDEWLSAFGQAADYDMSAPEVPESDLGWLDASTPDTAPESTPASSAAESPFWVAGDEPEAAPAEDLPDSMIDDDLDAALFDALPAPDFDAAEGLADTTGALADADNLSWLGEEPGDELAGVAAGLEAAAGLGGTDDDLADLSALFDDADADFGLDEPATAPGAGVPDVGAPEPAPEAAPTGETNLSDMWLAAAPDQLVELEADTLAPPPE